MSGQPKRGVIGGNSKENVISEYVVENFEACESNKKLARSNRIKTVTGDC